MKMNMDNERVFEAIKAFFINTLINEYAVERVAFGYEKPGEPAPIDLYLNELRVNVNEVCFKRSDIPGVYINEQEHITDEQDYNEFVRDLFVMQMKRIFNGAPANKRSSADEELPFGSRLREYLSKLIPIFTEIIKLDVEYTPFDLIPQNEVGAKAEYQKRKNLVTSIFLKRLERGERINKYVKDLRTGSYFTDKLIEKRGKNFYLRTASVNSNEYILALFSLMRFMNSDNNSIFELKMRKWEKFQNASE